MWIYNYVIVYILYVGGFISVADILAQPDALKSGHTEADVRRIVANCPKQRFALKEGPPLLIRANQGHSIEVY